MGRVGHLEGSRRSGRVRRLGVRSRKQGDADEDVPSDSVERDVAAVSAGRRRECIQRRFVHLSGHPIGSQCLCRLPETLERVACGDRIRSQRPRGECLSVRALSPSIAEASTRSVRSYGSHVPDAGSPRAVPEPLSVSTASRALPSAQCPRASTILAEVASTAEACASLRAPCSSASASDAAEWSPAAS